VHQQPADCATNEWKQAQKIAAILVDVTGIEQKDNDYPNHRTQAEYIRLREFGILPASNNNSTADHQHSKEQEWNPKEASLKLGSPIHQLR
jgi:hypothetical protein